MADFRIHFYQNFSTLLAAGVPILRAIRTLQNLSPRRHRRMLESFEKEISGGSELSEVLARRPRLFDQVDVMLVRVGEQTGQLPEIFKSMGDWHQQRQAQKRMVIGGLIYPLFLFHAAVFLLPVPLAVLGGGGLNTYFHYVITILLSLYIPLTAIFLFKKCTPSKGLLRRIYDGMVLWIPLIGSAFRCLAIGRYCSVFSMMYKAGIPILRCAELAPKTCGNAAIACLFEKGYAAAKTGQPMSLGFSRTLPPDFLELWAIGEESGDLDKTTAKLAEIYMDKAQFRFNLMAIWTPRVLYFALVFVLAFLIIKSIVHIYNTMIDSALNF